VQLFHCLDDLAATGAKDLAAFAGFSVGRHSVDRVREQVNIGVHFASAQALIFLKREKFIEAHGAVLSA
jgi:hypothetical protein